MRVFLIALMIALLPVRGWMSDAMAADPLAATVAETDVAHEIRASHANASRAEATYHSEISVKVKPMQHADCAGHDTATQATSCMEPHGNTCTLCQTCHTVALSAPAVSLAAMSLPHALPPAVLPRFVSADCALCIKPPIS